jgi:hypothetical protein
MHSRSSYLIILVWWITSLNITVNYGLRTFQADEHVSRRLFLSDWKVCISNPLLWSRQISSINENCDIAVPLQVSLKWTDIWRSVTVVSLVLRALTFNCIYLFITLVYTLSYVESARCLYSFGRKFAFLGFQDVDRIKINSKEIRWKVPTKLIWLSARINARESLVTTVLKFRIL